MSLSKKSAIIAMIILSGCSSGWLGSDSKKEKIKGERISVLSMGADLRVDVMLKDSQVVIPGAEYNNLWSKSSGHGVSPENPQAPLSFTKRTSVGIGKAPDSKTHLTASPVIGGGRVYTLDARGKITAFDAENIKHKIWNYKITIGEEKGDFTNGGLLYDDGKLYIATGYNYVIAVAADSGKEIWRRQVTSLARSAPAAGDGVVVVNTIDNISYGLDAHDGSIIWNHAGTQIDVSVVGTASPVVKNDIAYIPYSSGELYALRAADGNEIWLDSLADPDNSAAYALPDVDSSPLVSDDKVYAISADGLLAAMDPHNGQKIWETKVSSSNQPWLAGDYIYVIDSNNEVLCISTRTGGIKWISKLPSYKNEETKANFIEWQGPVMAGGNLLVVSSNGKLWSIAPDSGDVISKNKVAKDIYSAPVIAHNNLYLIDDNANMTVLRGSLENAKMPKPSKPETKPSQIDETIGEENKESLQGPGVGKKGEKVEFKGGEVELVLPEEEQEKHEDGFFQHVFEGIKGLFHKREQAPETMEND